MITVKKNIEPNVNELPSHYADRLGVHYIESVSKDHKKSMGQYFTPLSIARLMASLSQTGKKNISILDPGCGSAILSCALIENIIKQNRNIKLIELVVYETDINLTLITHQVLNYLKKWLTNTGINFEYKLLISDFIIDNANALSDSFFKNDTYDIIISNPPYFKLNNQDKRIQLAKMLISGQPNIYSIFLGIASKLLNKNGELIFITPRSFASGNYFKAFRKFFLRSVQLNHIHLFHSRKEAFKRDSVLQETIIVKASKLEKQTDYNINISSSNGSTDISNVIHKTFSVNQLIDFNSKEKILHLPINSSEVEILSLVSAWQNKLIDFKIQISTGKVVAFRATKYIQNNYENGNTFLSPLFWINNVDKMSLQWPLPLANKGQYIRNEPASLSLLVPNLNYIFLRRFSTKDDKSRLIAAPYFCNYYSASNIGVENKVNYLYKINGHLDRKEVVGLCALLNSELFDTYFKMINGNINVSATELREMKFPPLDTILNIGNLVIMSNDYSMKNVNNIINSIFKLENILTKLA
jgi:adenine-specific DNA-methyltransferase